MGDCEGVCVEMCVRGEWMLDEGSNARVKYRNASEYLADTGIAPRCGGLLISFLASTQS
jgi:hypothetical protein